MKIEIGDIVNIKLKIKVTEINKQVVNCNRSDHLRGRIISTDGVAYELLPCYVHPDNVLGKVE